MARIRGLNRYLKKSFFWAFSLSASSVFSSFSSFKVADFISSNGIAKKQLVQTGLSNDKFIEINNGLTAEDTVITTGNLDVEDGTPISNSTIEPEL